MRIVMFGATGMIGTGVLRECLDDPRVTAVLAVGRSRSGVSHPKLREHLRTDFLAYGDARAELTGVDACFFCLGVSAAGMREKDYRRLTYDVTVAAAQALAEYNPHLVFCYVSGEGTDRTERGRFMWARVKGATENHLLGMPIRAFMFRPGLVRPGPGVRSKTRAYRLVYAVLGPVYPLLERLFPTHLTTTVNLGRAMLEVAAAGYPRRVLENPDINALGGRARSSQ